MTREETEISLWASVYGETPQMLPDERKHRADAALEAFRKAFPNGPSEDREHPGCGCVAFNAAAEAAGATKRSVCSQCRP